MLAAHLADWSVENLLYIISAALTQVDKLLSRMGLRFKLRLQDCAFGFMPQLLIMSWGELVGLLKAVLDLDSDPNYRDMMMVIRLS